MTGKDSKLVIASCLEDFDGEFVNLLSKVKTHFLFPLLHQNQCCTCTHSNFTEETMDSLSSELSVQFFLESRTELISLSLGGFSDNSPLDTVERYDPKTNSWTFVAKMSCSRGGVGVASLGGLLYAVGGHNGKNYLNSVEAYDPLADRYVRLGS